jgi:hypothetical protein
MGDLELALYGSFLPIPSIELFQVKYLREKRKVNLSVFFIYRKQMIQIRDLIQVKYFLKMLNQL